MRWAPLVAVLLLAGCSGIEQAPGHGAPQPEPEPKKTSEAAPLDLAALNLPEGVEPYVDARGRLVCPVMRTPLQGAQDAVQTRDVDGVRYYLCCESCVAMFDKDPEAYLREAEEKSGSPDGT